VEGACQLLAAVASGSGFGERDWEDVLRRFRQAPLPDCPCIHPYVGYLEVRTDIIDQEFQITADQIEDIYLREYLFDQNITEEVFAEWIKSASLNQAGTLEEPEAEDISDSDTEDEPQPLVVPVDGG